MAQGCELRGDVFGRRRSRLLSGGTVCLLFFSMAIAGSAAASPGSVIAAPGRTASPGRMLQLLSRQRSTVEQASPPRRTSRRARITAAMPTPRLEGGDGRSATRQPLVPKLRPTAAPAYVGRQRPFRLGSFGYLAASSYADAIGRFYAMMPGGRRISSCTATVVGPNLVLTAAHCVYDLTSNKNDLQFLFVPGMRGTSAPVGTWSGDTAYYWSAFRSTPETSIDYAFVRLAPNDIGQNVGDVTGAYQILEYASPRSIVSEGYPASGPYARRCSLTSCYATYCSAPLGATYQDDFGGQLGMGCKSGHGASGGPWLTNYRNEGTVASVTSTGVSFHHAPFFRNLWGPTFDSDLDSLLQRAENG